MISVIIPVYNAENTLAKCLESVFANTYQNVEVILINDGSQDASWNVIQEYQRRYPQKIRAFNQENRGVAKTRNLGIAEATGEYTMFVDNDDFLDRDYFQTYVEQAERHGSDIVMGGYRRVTDQKTLFTMRLAPEKWSHYMVMAPWAKIYRKDFLHKNKLEFLANNIGEDVYFNLHAINVTEKISIIDYCGYNWFYNAQSVSNVNQKHVKNKLHVEFLLEKCWEKLWQLRVHAKAENEFYFFRYIVWYVLFAGRQSSAEEITSEFAKLFAWLKQKYPAFEHNRNISLWLPKGETRKNRIIVYLFFLLYKLKLLRVFFRMYATKKTSID